MNYTHEKHNTKHLRLDFYVTIHAQTTQVRRDSSGNKGRRCRILTVLTKNKGRKGKCQKQQDPSDMCSITYLPWTSPLNTWLFPARVASHSTDDKRICDKEITTCFMSGRKMGSSSTHCFANMATYIDKREQRGRKPHYNFKIENHRVQITYIFYDGLLRI